MTAPDVATRADLADLNARVAWCLDRHEYHDLRDLLTPDVHYVSVGREFHDVDAVIASFVARESGRTTRHALGNLLLERSSDDTATGRGCWHTFASNEDPPRGVPIFMVADFDDRYRRDADGTWRIAERIITPVFRDPALGPDLPRVRHTAPEEPQ